MTDEFTFCGIGIKAATDQEMTDIRGDGERIVANEDGYRLVSYYDKKTNRVFVSHELRVA